MQMDIADVIFEVRKVGWARIPYALESNLGTLAGQFGEVVPSGFGSASVDILEVKDATSATSRSLSGIYGRGAFPFHTDQAKELHPPRYMLLRHLAGDTRRPTLLVRFDALQFTEQQLYGLRSAVFLVNGGRGRFYSSIICRTATGQEFVRLDQHCMRPAHKRSGSVMEDFQSALARHTPVEIHWNSESVLVVDNWRVLHARAPESNTNSGIRVLERALVRPMENQ
jgi:alpha-ketoglutarate-dependent taurine dioxygenase